MLTSFCIAVADSAMEDTADSEVVVVVAATAVVSEAAVVVTA